ncbi:wsc domain-containing protein [Diplodia corticola]|uniref:Wsc domain-containing protein n=1 Tax=Diplodia corticola TaxID=236234 RepID=A0A1J9RYS6_9PEZI|nr:wsc domain-containing protein [Diplodia corticola]OJD33503.1 wsc domain-containing protein [Diplodia corticola]
MVKNAEILSLLALSGAANAFWRMPCRGRTGLARIDPIVDNGVVSGHAHAIHGGSSFGMSVGYAELLESSCTSCQVTQDNSAYWTPSLHFMYPNGTTVVVPQVGGMLAYYLLYGDEVTAFPKNFRMLAGDMRQRNFTLPVPDPEKPWTGEDATQSALAQKALGFNCLHYDVNPPEATLYRHFLPDKAFLDENCSSGLRLEVMFPSCWNGKDLDSDNHKDHMAYPDQTITGTCPEGFDTRLISLMYETIWATNDFIGVDGEFVLAHGDPTGYGYHGDFMSGWDVDFLQKAVDTCTSETGLVEDCPLFNLQEEDDMLDCKFPVPEALADENCAGPSDGLCGNVPIQYGPGYASVKPAVTSPAAISTTSHSSTPLVPTLSYSTGHESFASDKNGGGVTVAKIASKATGSASTIDLAAITPAPSASDADGEIIGTTTYTSNGAVYEVAIEEEVVYVTETGGSYATPVAKHKRHFHHGHHQNRREHGLLA